MTSPKSKTWRALFAVTLLGFLSIRAPFRPNQAIAIDLDGERDAGYTLLAQDPAGDLAPYFVGSPTTNWADLTNLYVAADAANLWVYVDLPNYGDNSTGEFGLAIDTESMADSGGSQDPNLNAITFNYTSTYNNIGATPIITTNVLLPDVVIRGLLRGETSGQGAGYTELRHWQPLSQTWDGPGVNWGGIASGHIGSHIAFSSGKGLELKIPYIDLGVLPTTTLNLEFYATGTVSVGHKQGAWDTVPPDDHSPLDDNVATTEQRLATFDLRAAAAQPLVSFSTSTLAAYEAAGTAPITITVAPTSTNLISVTLTTTDGTAGPTDYVPISQTLSFAPGQAVRVVPMQILTDAIPEPDETVWLTLSAPVNAELGQAGTATLTIRDSAPAPKILFLPLVRR